MDTPGQTIVAAPGFALGVKDNGSQLLEIRFLPPQAETEPSSPLAKEAAQQLRAWLKDPRSPFDLPLYVSGTDFRRKVWDAIAAIPLGQTRSYGDIAKSIASAPRAVGGACGDNPFPIIVPCHRVVARAKGLNGGLGGFAHHKDGQLMDVKRWLLDHEQKALRP